MTSSTEITTITGSPRRFFFKRAFLTAFIVTVAVSVGGLIQGIQMLKPMAWRLSIEGQAVEFLKQHEAPRRSFEDAIRIAEFNNDYWQDRSIEAAAARLAQRTRLSIADSVSRLYALKNDPERAGVHAKHPGLSAEAMYGADVLYLEDRIRFETEIPKAEFIKSVIGRSSTGAIVITAQAKEELKNSALTGSIFVPEKSAFELVMSSVTWSHQLVLTLLWFVAYTLIPLMLGWAWTHPQIEAKIVTFGLSVIAGCYVVAWVWNLYPPASTTAHRLSISTHSLLTWEAVSAGTAGLFALAATCTLLLGLWNVVTWLFRGPSTQTTASKNVAAEQLQPSGYRPEGLSPKPSPASSITNHVQPSIPWFFAPWNYPHAGWRRLSLVLTPVVSVSVFVVCYQSDDLEKVSPLIAIFALLLGAPAILCGRELFLWVRRGFVQELEKTN